MGLTIGTKRQMLIPADAGYGLEKLAGLNPHMDLFIGRSDALFHQWLS